MPHLKWEALQMLSTPRMFGYPFASGFAATSTWWGYVRSAPCEEPHQVCQVWWFLRAPTHFVFSCCFFMSYFGSHTHTLLWRVFFRTITTLTATYFKISWIEEILLLLLLLCAMAGNSLESPTIYSSEDRTIQVSQYLFDILDLPELKL